MKISIITPCFNSEKYIAETIESVLSQKGDYELEYIIVDGGSTDGTIEIIKKYEKEITSRHSSRVTFNYVSETDNGMYDAINKGFSMATGDVFAWINADDKYEKGVFQKIIKTFNEFSEIQWLKGITSYIDESSKVTQRGQCFLYKKDWIKKGFYGKYLFFIQQDSVFWRRELWEKVAPIDKSLKLAGDYWLWTQMAKHAELYSLNEFVSCFRQRKGQLSSEMEKYYAEMNKIREDFGLKENPWFFKQLEKRIKTRQLFNLLLKYILFYKTDCVFINEDGSMKIKKIHRMVV